MKKGLIHLMMLIVLFSPVVIFAGGAWWGRGS